MAKTASDRLTETLTYLQGVLTPAQHTEVRNKLQAMGPAMRDALSGEMSLGSVLGSPAGRPAKRALIMVTHMFLENAARKNAELTRVKALGDGAEAPLRAEILSWFTIANVTPTTVAQQAQANIGRMPNWNNQNYFAQDATRGVYNTAKTFNCYSAIVFWAFQAGAISRRYLYRYYEGKDGNAFFPTYSLPGWADVLSFAGGSALPNVDPYNGGPIPLPVGMTVYFETPAKVFGHVGLSLGGGRIISQNSVLAPPSLIAQLPPADRTEWDKMSRAVTHIVNIRDMVRIYFNGANGYARLKVSNAPFWNTIPADQL
ncbi:MAG: hypothetical protein J0L76_05695 [Rhodobacterales bacterium]|nr:hypothetical protein [Rhodobacterales bacterium]